MLTFIAKINIFIALYGKAISETPQTIQTTGNINGNTAYNMRLM